MNYDKYVKLQNSEKNRKAPTKDQGYTLEEIMTNNWNYGRRVDKGYIFIDFDDMNVSNIMNRIILDLNLKCKRLITDHGMQFLFKTDKAKVLDGSKGYNWLGLVGDRKGLGTKENDKVPGYQAIKLLGKQRVEEYLGGAKKDEDLSILPKWLYKASAKRQIDLTKDQKGSRNDMFHGELMIEAKKNNFTYEEYQLIASLINEYVLPEGLSKEELATAIRQEEWDKLELGEDKMELLDMALDVIEHWGCMYVEGQLMFYDQEYERYNSDTYRIECYIQEKYARDNITKNRIKEVMDQMDIQLKNYEKYQTKRNSEYVICDKENVSVWKDDRRPVSRTIVTDVFYPYKFMSPEEFAKFDGRMVSFLNEISCGQEKVKRVILEMVGCMLAPTNTFGKIFICYGSGQNGKSKLFQFVQTIMGPLCTSSHILNLNDNFGLQTVMKGIANVTDDLGTSEIRETGILKTIVDGSSMEVNRKYMTPIKWKPNTQFVVGTNNIPQIKDTSGGMTRRLAFIPFDMQLTMEQRDNDLIYKIESNEDNYRYLMTAGILAFRNAKKRGRLTELDTQKELEKDFIEENKDQIEAFYDYMVSKFGENNIGISERDMFIKWLCDGVNTTEMYENYVNWVKDTNDGKIETQLKFSRRFKRYLPQYVTTKVMKIGSKAFSIYVKV